MNVHYLQHASFEGPGAIAHWARARGHSLVGTHSYKGDPIPPPDDFDLLVVMGGPMSVDDEKEFPWLIEEKDLVARSLKAEKKVLGICLGAQILASVLGARVYKAREKEIGWFPVRLRAEARLSATTRSWPESFTPFHWHGETFDLPSGSIHLAETGICPIQAFECGRAVGIQFHLEVTPDGVRDFLGACQSELVAGPFIQSEEEVHGTETQFAAMKPLLFGLLDQM
jgi:GMP synthase-like glutamine amidotransferase